MSKPFLSNNPALTIMDSTSSIAVGAKVFTYQAGTTTKLTTYPTQTDALALTNANANPVIANSAGKTIAIWATQAIKLVYSPSNDTDPPTASFSTVDNLTGIAQTVVSTSKTTNYTITAADRDKLVECDASGGSIVITLLASASAGDGFNLKFKKIDSSTNTVTVTANGAETIDGVNSLTLGSRWDYLETWNDGTQWLRSYNIPAQVLKDTNSNNELSFTTTTGAVNYFNIANAATSTNPTFSATGSDTNIGINVNVKGTGTLAITGNTAVTGNVTVTGTTVVTGASTFNGGTTTFNGKTSGQAVLTLQGNTTNNTNTVSIQPPSNIAASSIITLPNGVGTLGQGLITDGTGALSFANIAIKSVNVQTFSSSGTYTPTSGMLFSIAEVLGAGGGSGGMAGTSNTGGAGGGGAGGWASALYTASQIGASQAVTIGAAGGAASSGANNGGSGGTTSLGSLLSATGGAGGTGGTTSATSGNTVSGGAGGTGTVSSGITIGTQAGQPGSPSVSFGATAAGWGGNGGSSRYGGGGLGAMNSSAVGAAGSGHGAGGGGSFDSGAAQAGAAGSGGYIVIHEFIG